MAELDNKLTLKQIKDAYYLKEKRFILTGHALKRMQESDRLATMKDLHQIIQTSWTTSHHSIRDNLKGFPDENITCRITGRQLDGRVRRLAVKINKDGMLVILTII